MIDHSALIDLAALDAAGALDDSSRRLFVARLADASDDQRRAVADVYDAASIVLLSSLASQPGSAGPSGQVKQRLMERLGPARGFFSIRADEGEWQALVPGVEAKLLRLDPEKQTATFLARIAPGVVFPAHHHSGPEECYVISGDVVIQGQHLHAGDFHHADAGSDHDSITSLHGGEVILIVAAADYHPGR
jgi:quercetin dioxygenase-like cupin family protein